MVKESAQPCGCDPGIDWTCLAHQEIPDPPQWGVDSWAGEDVAPIPVHGPDGYSERAFKQAFASAPPTGNVPQPSFDTQLREQFPHGHKSFLPITIRELQLHSDKNHDYAAGGDALGNFKRVATLLGQYPALNLSDPKVVALVYALKQLDAVLWGLNSGIVHKVEGLASRLQDISVYAKIVQCMLEEQS